MIKGNVSGLNSIPVSQKYRHFGTIVLTVDIPGGIGWVHRSKKRADRGAVGSSFRRREYEWEDMPGTARSGGSYSRLEDGQFYSIKRITVPPQKRISLQMHYHRSEHWILVRGTAKVAIDGKELLLRKGENTFVPIGSMHRLENPGLVPLEIIEVQIGDYIGEDDIVKYDDDYERLEK